MANEKQIEPSNWKNKLNALDSLPGEPVANKDAAWEKLHARLHEKPRRKMAAWYWLAAACLFLILALPWMITGKKDDNLVKIKLPEKSAPRKPITNVPAIQPQTAVASPVSFVEKNQTIKNNIKTTHHSKVPILKKASMEKEELLMAGSTIPPETNSTSADIVQPADTAGIVATVAVVKTKMRVVHINELETSAIVNPDQVASTMTHSPHRFRVSFINVRPSNNNKAAQHAYAALKIRFTN